VKGPRRTTLIAIACVAVLIAAIDSAGWWWWQDTSRNLAVDSARGVQRLLYGWGILLPSTVQLSRRLATRDLASAPSTDVVAALERLSRHQERWMSVDANGFTNGAVAAFLSHRTNDGIRDLRAALLRDPTAPRLHRLMALALQRAGFQQRCLEHLAEANAIAAATDGPMLELADEERRWVRLEGLRRRMDWYPRERSGTAVELARELRDQGDQAAGDEVLSANARHPEVALERARWDLDAGRFEPAEAEALAIARRQRYPAALRVRAWAVVSEVRERGGDSDGALTAAREALRLGPESAAPYLALATLAEHRSAYEEALQHLRRAWGVAPTDVGVLLRVSVVAERAGHPADARLALVRAVDLAPGDVSLVARLVDFHLRHGDFTEAAMRLSGALDRFPTDRRLLTLGDRLRREVGRLGE
jgi:hypothetical protein